MFIYRGLITFITIYHTCVHIYINIANQMFNDTSIKLSMQSITIIFDHTRDLQWYYAKMYIYTLHINIYVYVCVCEGSKRVYFSRSASLYSVNLV